MPTKKKKPSLPGNLYPLLEQSKILIMLSTYTELYEYELIPTTPMGGSYLIIIIIGPDPPLTYTHVNLN